ncbi:MAG: type VI secretion system ImpA family N-terminal domain-containing protein [Paracoccaceae bacterium]
MTDLPVPEEPLDPDLLKPLGGAEPMGPPLEDAEIMPLELAVRRGDPADRDSFSHDAAVGGYAQRRDAALERLERTRDLRLYVRLAEALAWSDGPKAFHGAIAGLAHMVESHWQEIHPGPADDPSAQSLRVRAFTPLRNRLLANAFEPVVVFDARERDGEITLRMIYHAAGRHDASRLRRPASGETVYPADGMHGLVARVGAGAEIATMRDAMLGAAGALRRMQAFFVETEGFDTLRFAGDGRRRGLIDELEDYAAALAAFVPEETAGIAAAEPGAEEGAAEQGPVPVAGGPTPTPPSDLATREEALALIDDVLRYFALSARSSPIALALIKIREMERATFYQWLEETVQEGRDWAQLPIWNVDAASLDRYAEAQDDAPAEDGGAPPPAGRTAHLDALEETHHQLRSLMWDVDSLASALLRAREELGAHAAALAETRERLAAGEADVSLPDAPEPPSPPALDPAVFREIADRVQAAQEALAAEPAAATGPVAGGAAPGRVVDRAGVRAALLALGRHWRATEPSSPAALAMEKLAEMVDLAFIDVVRQVAADDVSRPALRLARNPARE